MIDTHSHIYEPEFDLDRAEALQRCVEHDVGLLMLPAIDGESYERMFALNDRQFIKMIGERIIRIVVETILGRVSKEKCKESLGLENGINDYLLDWNFFLYSSVNNRYYTSFMEYKLDYCHVWCDRQWEIRSTQTALGLICAAGGEPSASPSR